MTETTHDEAKQRRLTADERLRLVDFMVRTLRANPRLSLRKLAEAFWAEYPSLADITWSNIRSHYRHRIKPRLDAGESLQDIDPYDLVPEAHDLPRVNFGATSLAGLMARFDRLMSRRKEIAIALRQSDAARQHFQEEDRAIQDELQEIRAALAGPYASLLADLDGSTQDGVSTDGESAASPSARSRR